VKSDRTSQGDPVEEIVRKPRIRFTFASGDWLCAAALAGQPFVPFVSYDVLAELLADGAGHRASRSDEHRRAFPPR
jgi:hypothetical protein